MKFNKDAHSMLKIAEAALAVKVADKWDVAGFDIAVEQTYNAIHAKAKAGLKELDLDVRVVQSLANKGWEDEILSEFRTKFICDGYIVVLGKKYITISWRSPVDF